MSQVIGVTVCPNSSSAQLGVLAPGLPQNEVFRIVEPQHEVFVPLLPQNGVLILSHNEVLKSVPANCQLLCNLKLLWILYWMSKLRASDYGLGFCYMVQKN
jgi:hypothetical protein